MRLTYANESLFGVGGELANHDLFEAVSSHGLVFGHQLTQMGPTARRQDRVESTLVRAELGLAYFSMMKQPFIKTRSVFLFNSRMCTCSIETLDIVSHFVGVDHCVLISLSLFKIISNYDVIHQKEHYKAYTWAKETSSNLKSPEVSPLMSFSIGCPYTAYTKSSH